MSDYILLQIAVLNFMTKYVGQTIVSSDLCCLFDTEETLQKTESEEIPLWFYSEAIVRKKAQGTLNGTEENFVYYKMIFKNKMLNSLRVLFYEVLCDNKIALFHENGKYITKSNWIAANFTFYQELQKTHFTKFHNKPIYFQKDQWKKVFNIFFSKISPEDKTLITNFKLNNTIVNLNHQLWYNNKVMEIMQLFPKETSYSDEGEVEKYLLQHCISDVGMKSTIQRTFLPVLRAFLKAYQDSKELEL
jgi:hypothetical protein